MLRFSCTRIFLGIQKPQNKTAGFFDICSNLLGTPKRKIYKLGKS